MVFIFCFFIDARNSLKAYKENVDDLQKINDEKNRVIERKEKELKILHDKATSDSSALQTKIDELQKSLDGAQND